MNFSRSAQSLASTLLLIATSACFLSTSVQGSRITVARPDSATVPGPIKAHLIDGSIVVFPNGLRVMRNEAIGEGWRYAPSLHDSTFVHGFAVDSVAAMEAFHNDYDVVRSVLVSAIAISAASLAVLGAAIAFFASARYST